MCKRSRVLLPVVVNRVNPLYENGHHLDVVYVDRSSIPLVHASSGILLDKCSICRPYAELVEICSVECKIR